MVTGEQTRRQAFRDGLSAPDALHAVQAQRVQLLPESLPPAVLPEYRAAQREIPILDHTVPSASRRFQIRSS